ncbi:hypothetical protein AB0F77_15130 [Streptomyces sp. NPDC026672]|uniref:hypothetical protein n=1 Tax=unclassified Streptomyces TaxID=2593676 RepID=UPI0033F47D3F
MSTPRRPPLGRAWLRAWVLLLALLVPAAHIEAHTVRTVAADVVEHDVPDPGVRPVSRTVQRPLLPVRPGSPGEAPALVAGEERPPTAPHPRPYTALALRSVVLRC